MAWLSIGISAFAIAVNVFSYFKWVRPTERMLREAEENFDRAERARQRTVMLQTEHERLRNERTMGPL